VQRRFVLSTPINSIFVKFATQNGAIWRKSVFEDTGSQSSGVVFFLGYPVGVLHNTEPELHLRRKATNSSLTLAVEYKTVSFATSYVSTILSLEMCAVVKVVKNSSQSVCFHFRCFCFAVFCVASDTGSEARTTGFISETYGGRHIKQRRAVFSRRALPRHVSQLSRFGRVFISSRRSRRRMTDPRRSQSSNATVGRARYREFSRLSRIRPRRCNMPRRARPLHAASLGSVSWPRCVVVP